MSFRNSIVIIIVEAITISNGKTSWFHSWLRISWYDDIITNVFVNLHAGPILVLITREKEMSSSK